MGKKKKIIIIILLILIVLLVLLYFLIFNKSYTLTVYKYQINNQENIGKTMPKDATLIEQYDVKCNKKCELITYDYDKTFFVVKNKKEGYIYNTLTKKAIDVGPHDKLNMISVNKDDQMVKIGYILTKNDNEILFIDEIEQKVTIPWTKDLKLNNVFINNKYLVADKNFINIHTGKVHNIEKPFETYTCFTLNTCVFNHNNKSFIYNFDEEKIYDYNFKVLINYENGMVIEKDNKIYNLDLKTNKEIYLMDKPNLTYSDFCDYLHCPDDVDKNELLLNFYNKETCKSYIYNPLTNKLNTKECKIVE